MKILLKFLTQWKFLVKIADFDIFVEIMGKFVNFWVKIEMEESSAATDLIHGVGKGSN